MRQAKLLDQAGYTTRFFQRAQVFTLNIFDQGDRNGLFILNLSDDHRHFIKLRDLSRTPASFPGDNLILPRR